MCGIAGISNFCGNVERSDIQAMTDALIHRGPDGGDVWVGGSVAFGHRRLAIRDLTDAGKQPMADPSGRVHVTYNGEIYNDVALREEITKLTGYEFVTRCDTEIIPAGYLAWGEGLFDKLEGMFAIALWDAAEDKLILARDPVGIKPLYYSEVNDGVRFASEVKALLVLDDQPRELSPHALHAFMAQGYVSPTQSLLSSVKQVAPGSYLVFEKGSRVEHCYWTPTRQPCVSDEQQALEDLRAKLSDVAENMLVSDVPVSILQSGGIDSTLISYTLKDKHKLSAFTAQFSSAKHDESDFAQMVAADCGYQHHRIPVNIDRSDAEDTFRRMVFHADGQIADSSSFAVYKLMEAVRTKGVVVLGGDGADEFFGGYPTYRATRIAALLRPFLPGALWRRIGRFFMGRPGGEAERVSRAEKIGRFAYGMGMSKGSQHAQWRRLLPAHLMPVLYGEAMQTTMEDDPLNGYVDALTYDENTRLVDRAMRADQAFYLPSDMLMKVDAMSMAHGVEVRVPFLDRRIMDYAGALDHKLLTPMKGPDKKILRDLLSYLGAPENITKHPKKGFNVPVAKMLREELCDLCEKYLIEKGDRFIPYFRPDGISTLWHEHKNKKADHGYTLWALLVLGLWLEQLNP